MASGLDGETGLRVAASGMMEHAVGARKRWRRVSRAKLF